MHFSSSHNSQRTHATPEDSPRWAYERQTPIILHTICYTIGINTQANQKTGHQYLQRTHIVLQLLSNKNINLPQKENAMWV